MVCPSAQGTLSLCRHSYSHDHMHAAIEVNLPYYTNAIVTADEIVAAISPLAAANFDAGS